MKIKKVNSYTSTARVGYKVTLFFEADPSNDLKGVIHDTESAIFNNRRKSTLEEITNFSPLWRTGLFGVN